MKPVLELRLEEFLESHPEIQKTGKKFKHKNSSHLVKLPKKFSPELCRLLGIIQGDGNMSFDRIVITDKCLEYHVVIQNLFEKVFSVKPNLFHDKKRHTYYSHIKRMAIYKFLTEVLEVPKGSVRRGLLITSYMNLWDKKLRSSYLGGLFDSEGHVGKKQAKISFTITSKEIFDFVKNFLLENEIKVSEYKRKRHEKPEYEIYIYGKQNIQKMLKFVKLYHPDKVSRLKLFSFH